MNSTSSELRAWAARCDEMAATARTENERMSLLRKADGLRALAESEDWLAGHVSDQNADLQPQPTLRSLAAE